MNVSPLSLQESPGRPQKNEVLPTFLVIGAGKCGTTSFSDLLSQHPDVYICPSKEPHFFASEKFEQEGREWYAGLFQSAAAYPARGEASTTNTMRRMYPGTARRVWEILPEAKLIYLVRDPLERMRSHWMDFASQNPPPRELRGFNRTVRDWPHLLDMSSYWGQLEEYRRFYGDEQILVLFFEDLITDRSGVLRQSFEFLGVDSSYVPAIEKTRRNASVGRYTDRAFYRSLRRIPCVNNLAARVPDTMKLGLRRLLKVRHRGKPSWQPAVRQATVEALQDDALKLLDFAGKPSDFWPSLRV